MSAYVVVEATVRDPEARDRYGSQIGLVLKQFGGEILAFGPWQLLFGEPAYRNGMIIRFPDKDTALTVGPSSRASTRSAYWKNTAENTLREALVGGPATVLAK